MLDAALPPFPGFRKEAFQFLRELKANNDRAWFKARKSTFDDEVLWPMRCLVAQLGNELPARGLPIAGDPDRAVFRIYRDTRFSPNKDPYKTHIGAYLTRSGDRKEDGGVYVHVGADECFFGGGFWNADPGLVRRWRERMASNPGEFMDIVAGIEQAGLEMRRQDPLKRLPRGYESEAASPAAEYLKAKGIFAMRPIKEKDAGSPTMVETVLDAAGAVRPLLEWGWGLE
jgi:uncharacterized protein (TIGR02453 family)